MTTKDNSLPALVQRMEPEFKRALGNAVPSDRFTRIALTAVNGNPELATLERSSLMKAIMQAAQDGLVIDGKEAVVIPFKGKAQYLPMVAGLTKKIRQHSDFASLSTGIIYQNEVTEGRFEYVKGDTEYLRHDPIIFGAKGEPVGAYAIVTTKDGQKFRAVMDRAAIEKRRNAGRAGVNGPWGSWTEEMWIKTVIKAVYKIAPNSGDEAGVLDQVFGRDEEEAIDHDPAPATAAAPEPEKPVNRAAAAVKRQSAPPPEPEIMDAEVLPPDPEFDEEPPM